MGRQPLPIGTWGKIRTYVHKVDDKGKPIRYRAVAQFRDFNGRTPQVEAYGPTATAAGNALRTKLTERAKVGGVGELTASHRFSVAADQWLARFEQMVKADRRSPTSLDTYRKMMRRHVLPALGEVRLGEATTPLVDKVISKVAADAGAATAKTCRSVISGVLALAVRRGALMANPVREVEAIEAPKKPPRSISDDELVDWFAALRADKRAVRKDLPDLTLFMLSTGCRIGEALAVLWDQVDLAAGTVDITHTVVRVVGQGLIRKWIKNRFERALPLPLVAVAMLRRRFVPGTQLDRPVFANSLGGFRDPSNTSRDIRVARGPAAMEWLTSHNYRKTTATVMDDAGFSARQVADQLGHARVSMTQDNYMGRRVANPAAAEALDVRFRDAAEGENHG